MVLLGTIGLQVLTSNSYAQTGATSPSFGKDKCIWWEDSDGTVKNVFCGKMILDTDSMIFTNNNNGSFTVGGASFGAGGCWELNASLDLMPVSGDCTGVLWEQNGDTIRP